MQRAAAIPPPTATSGKNRTRLWLITIVIASTALSLAYGIANPLFEAPDEQHHYFTVETIATEWVLPSVGVEPDGWLRQEAAQPPLYYALGAAIIAPLQLDPASSRAAVVFNPYVQPGNPTTLGNNVNAFVHGPGEAFPWQNHVLAGHLLRMLSALLGAGTVLCIYAAGRLLWPDSAEIPLLAAALVGFLPQFNFVSATISNDSLIIFLACAALWQLIRLWQQPVTNMRLLLLGVTIGLAALTKNQGILLLFYAVGVLALLAWRERKRRLFGRMTLLVVLPAVGLAGWLWLRNWRLYGDPTATNQFVRLAGGDRGFSLTQAIAALWRGWPTFIGRFGWANIPLPQWIYAIWFAIITLAILGALVALLRRKPALGYVVQSPSLWLAGWIVLILAAQLRFVMQTSAEQGRLLFPALLPVALGVAWGIGQWRRHWIISLVGGAALLTALYSLIFVQLSAFNRPQLLDVLPQHVAPLNLEMGDGITLLGTEIETDVAEPGDSVTATLYWQIDQSLHENIPVSFELLGREFQQVGRFAGYHGRGQFPTSLWSPGKVVAETITLPLAAEARVPTALRLYVSVDDGPAHVVAVTKAAPAESPEFTDDIAAFIGRNIQLIDPILLGLSVTPGADIIAQPGETVQIGLSWQVTAPVERHYTTLIHVLDKDGNLVAQGDSPPRGGDYPTTLWAAGERFGDQYAVMLPETIAPGNYTVWIGMYDTETVTRLPLVRGDERMVDDVLQIGRIIVP
ncbi:MAG: glycosyltransferase family 39 protein [Anaerolineae bacterium]|nr:glycosyltransferase family 39 protein [Anaerolineae bacterium]